MIRQYAIYDSDGAFVSTRYRSLWFVVFNNILRIIQFWTKEKLVLTVVCDSWKYKDSINEVITGYRFGKVKHCEFLPITFNSGLRKMNLRAIEFKESASLKI